MDTTVSENLYVTKLYKVYTCAETLCVTDNFEKASNVFKAHDGENICMISIKPVFNCDDFDIIENDKDGDYGFSECYWKEDCIDITMFKHRLNVSKDDYETAMSDLTENPGTWENCKTSGDAIRTHMKYWCKTVSPEEMKLLENAPCFPISANDMTILLKTGFDGARFLHAQGPSNPALKDEEDE